MIFQGGSPVQNPSLAQWACYAAVFAILIYPRLGSIKTAAYALLAKAWPAKAATTETTDADRVAAFILLRPSLTPEVAATVWQAIQPKEVAP
jgi:hypothetical protein